MNFHLSLSVEPNGRWRASETNSGTHATASRLDTAVGRLVLLMVVRGQLDCGPNMAGVRRLVLWQTLRELLKGGDE